MSRIMIVDDDQDIIKYLDTLLTKQGHEVFTSTDTYRALNVLKTHNIDLLVMDIIMPTQIDGFELLKRLKKINHFHAPILMLTARTAKEDVLQALELGATDYMCKPFDNDVFLSKLNTLLANPNTSPEISFAQGSTYSQTEISFDATIISVSEMGMRVRSKAPMERNVRVKVNSTVFREIGIATPPLRVATCKELITGPKAEYELFISFIGLDEVTMQKIRRWITVKSTSFVRPN